MKLYQHIQFREVTTTSVTLDFDKGEEGREQSHQLLSILTRGGGSVKAFAAHKLQIHKVHTVLPVDSSALPMGRSFGSPADKRPWSWDPCR